MRRTKQSSNTQLQSTQHILSFEILQSIQVYFYSSVCVFVNSGILPCKRNTTQVALLCRREPRDALCPPVISSDSVIPRVQSFIITYASDLPLHTIKCCSVVFGLTLTLLVIKHFVIVSCHQQTVPLTSN